MIGSLDALSHSDAEGAGRFAPAIQVAHEFDVWSPDERKSELDVVISNGARLLVGEATTSSRFESTNGKESKRFARLAEVSSLLNANVLLITSSTFTEGTKKRAVYEVGSKLVFMEQTESVSASTSH